jgi:hypothetical protein
MKGALWAQFARWSLRSAPPALRELFEIESLVEFFELVTRAVSLVSIGVADRGHLCKKPP